MQRGKRERPTRPGRSLAAFFDNELIISFFYDVARIGVKYLGVMNINVIIGYGAVFAVRHHEINFCGAALIFSHRLIQRRRVSVYYIVGVERYDGRG